MIIKIIKLIYAAFFLLFISNMNRYESKKDIHREVFYGVLSIIFAIAALSF